MAFIQDTPVPNTGTSAPVAPGDTSDVIRLGGVEDAIKFAGRALSGLSDTARKAGQDEALAGAIGGINDLIEERESTLGAERQVGLQLAEVSADGEITDEERKSLGAISESREFLQTARETGILSQAGFSTRLNALRRSSVARAENLGIQSQIEKLFLDSQTLSKAPLAVDPVTKFVTESMDALKGKGNWTTVDAADFLSNERKAQTLMTDLTTDPGQYAFTMTNHMEKVITKMQTDTQNGVIFTQQDLTNISLNAADQANGFLSVLEEKRAALNTTGRLTAGRSAQIDEAAASVIAVRDSYNKLLTDEESRISFFTFNEAAERSIKGMQLYNELNMTPEERIVERMMGTDGSNNGIPGDVWISLLDADNPRSERLANLLVEREGLGRSPDEFRKSLAIGLNRWMSPKASNEELVAKGVIVPEVLRVINMEVQRIPARSDEEYVFKLDQQKSLFPKPNDTEGNTANMAVLAQGFEQMFTESKRLGQSTEFTAATKDQLRRNATELTGFILKKTPFVLGVTLNGDVVVNFRPEAAANLDALSESQQRVSNELRAQLQVFGDYTGKAIESGVITLDDLSDMITTDRSFTDPQTGVSIDATTGAPKPVTGQTGALPTPVTTTPQIVPQALSDVGVTEPVDADIQAAIQLESGGDPTAVNPSGATGILQLTPERAKEEGIDPLDPNASIRVFKEHRDNVTPLLQRNNITADGTNVYILWQQGNTGGLEILKNQDKKLSEISKPRRSNMLNNQPPVPEWQAIDDKSEATVSQWVDGWRTRFNQVQPG